MQSEKGSRRERELTNLFDSCGFAVMRAPASGGATNRELPDLLVGNGGDFYAIEAKSSSGAPIYIPKEEIEQLTYFARNFGAEERVGVKFDLDHGHPDRGNPETGWFFFHPDDLYVTDGGNYRIKLEKALEDGTRFKEIIEDSEWEKFIEEE